MPGGTATPPRYAYLDCEDAAKWAGHEALAFQLLQPGAEWRHFRCYRGELPALEGLGEQFRGVLISGSHYSVYEGHPWIRQLEAWLRQAVAQHPRVRFLGMCFGHQVLAAALGGRVGKNASGRFVLGVERVELLPALRRCAALRLAAAEVGAPALAAAAGSSGAAAAEQSGDSSGLCPVASVSLIESHGDCVLELPPGAVLLARSPTAPVEMFTLAGGNVLGGHAELSAADTLEKIHAAVAAAGRLSAEEAAEAERSLREDADDAALVVALYRHFMTHGLPEAAAAAEPTAAAAAAEAAEPAAAAEAAAAAAAPAAVAEPEQGWRGASGEAGQHAAETGEPAGAARGGGSGATPSSPAASSLRSVPGSPASDTAPRGSSAAAAARLLEQLDLAVGAELAKGLSEQKLLRWCNEAAAARYQQQGDVAAAAAQRLKGLAAQAAEAPAWSALDELEAQVAALEATLVELDTGSRRLQARLAGAAASGGPAAP